MCEYHQDSVRFDEGVSLELLEATPGDSLCRSLRRACASNEAKLHRISISYKYNSNGCSHGFCSERTGGFAGRTYHGNSAMRQFDNQCRLILSSCISICYVDIRAFDIPKFEEPLTKCDERFQRSDCARPFGV